MRPSHQIALVSFALAGACVAADPELEEVESAFAMHDHWRLTEDACRETGLPRDLCIRMALEDYNTDTSEIDDPAAHAQSPANVDPCVGANRVLDRMVRVGEDYREALETFRGQAPAERAAGQELTARMLHAAGRALHTFEDNFAHAGMMDPEHAWYSLQDLCRGTSSNPDKRPGALQAARTAVGPFLEAIARDLQTTGMVRQIGYWSCPLVGERPQIATNACALKKIPGLGRECDFLAESSDWDGVDRQWNASLMTEAIRDAFFTGTVRDMCQEPDFHAEAAAPVDVSRGAPRCLKMNVACLGTL